jgi:hypothetical protein
MKTAKNKARDNARNNATVSSLLRAMLVLVALPLVMSGCAFVGYVPEIAGETGAEGNRLVMEMDDGTPVEVVFYDGQQTIGYDNIVRYGYDGLLTATDLRLSTFRRSEYGRPFIIDDPDQTIDHALTGLVLDVRDGGNGILGEEVGFDDDILMLENEDSCLPPPLIVNGLEPGYVWIGSDLSTVGIREVPLGTPYGVASHDDDADSDTTNNSVASDRRGLIERVLPDNMSGASGSDVEFDPSYRRDIRRPLGGLDPIDPGDIDEDRRRRRPIARPIERPIHMLTRVEVSISMYDRQFSANVEMQMLQTETRGYRILVDPNQPNLKQAALWIATMLEMNQEEPQVASPRLTVSIGNFVSVTTPPLYVGSEYIERLREFGGSDCRGGNRGGDERVPGDGRFPRQ